MSSSSFSSSSVSPASSDSRVSVPVQKFSDESIHSRMDSKETTMQWIPDSTNNTEKFRVMMNIEGFHPYEISARANGYRLFVYGEHVENKSQGMSKKILDQSYPLPVDVDQYRFRINFPTSTWMQVDFPAQIRSRATYSRPQLIGASKSIIPVRKTLKVGFRDDQTDSLSESSLFTTRSESPSSNRSSVTFRDHDSQSKSLFPSDFDSEEFYRSIFHPQIVTDNQDQTYIEMKLNVQQFNPDDIQISLNGYDLLVHVVHTSFAEQITLPPNTHLSSLYYRHHHDGHLYITAKLFDDFSSITYL